MGDEAGLLLQLGEETAEITIEEWRGVLAAQGRGFGLADGGAPRQPGRAPTSAANAIRSRWR